MANCQEFKQWLTNQDSADENTFRQMENHIQICPTCEILYHADMALDTILKNGIQVVEPPPDLRRRPFDGRTLLGDLAREPPDP